MKLFKKAKKEEKEQTIDDFSFCVDYKKDYIDKQTIVFGHVEGQIKYLEYMHLVGPKGLNTRVKINKLIEVIPDDYFYALLVDREIGNLVDKGYIFTYEQVNTTNDVNEVSNHYIHYLLDEMHKGHYQYLDTLLEELALHSDFISIFDEKKRPIVSIEGKEYYPLFSCREELEKYKKDQKTYVFALSDYIRIVLNEPSYEGIIINPINKKRSIILNTEILKQIEIVKNKNMEEYRMIKQVYQKKVR
ncbi:MAG: SseB family protein [Faecalibacillus sp.]